MNKREFSSSTAFHAAARSYCLDRQAKLGAVLLPLERQYWEEWLRSRNPRDSVGQIRPQVWISHLLGADLEAVHRIQAQTGEARQVSPKVAEALAARSQILQAILEKIERTRPDEYATVEEMRARLLAIGREARVIERGGSGRTITDEREVEWERHEARAVEAERNSFLIYLARLTPEEAAQVPLAPYRRVLSEEERRVILAQLGPRWEINPDQHYWYPLDDLPRRPDVLAVQDAYFYSEVGAETLREILRRHGINRVWELHECAIDPDREMATELADFVSNGEAYWSSAECDWVIYHSHEHSLTFAGDWLVASIKQEWPNWRQRIYTGWDYQ